MNVPLYIELIIVNDASTDDTGEILKNEIQVKYPKIIVLTHTVNKGIQVSAFLEE